MQFSTQFKILQKMKRKDIDADTLIHLMKDYKWVRYVLYTGCAVIGIWVFGKASKLLSNAVVNFKSLHNAIKH